jgi:hypothetical protein
MEGQYGLKTIMMMVKVVQYLVLLCHLKTS